MTSEHDPVIGRLSVSRPPDPTGYGVPEDVFRALAGSIPTGVSVVTTCDDDGRPVGLTSSAVCGLSCVPPLMLVCIDRRSRTLRHILGRGVFCVNVLDAGSAGLADRFAGSGDAKFAGIPWTMDACGVPVLDGGTAAHAVCDVSDVLDGGDHMIVIGLVAGGTETPGAVPLLYHRRRYAGFPESAPSRPDA
ncbi:flavin reductase family protein [Actinomadura sp. 1N219]|uniref:flavin reductase family protein n=1 Tax=Actinomadura sp. 1N219 TaxID=3375152 RepID=UPI0037A33751